VTTDVPPLALMEAPPEAVVVPPAPDD